MRSDLLVPAAFGAVFGLWWALAPNSVIGFYRSFGNRQFQWLGSKGVRALGLAILSVIGCLVVTLLVPGLAR
jgi:hypothetical protein